MSELIPTRTQFLGLLESDPDTTSLAVGQWWINTTDNQFKYFDGDHIAELGGHFLRQYELSVPSIVKGPTNPPTSVDQDNLILYKFTLDTDKIAFTFEEPYDYDEIHGEGIDIHVLWTNDGGVDDNGKTVKWQLAYQVGNAGDVISGTLDTLTVQDTYTSDLGWVLHTTDYVTIPYAHFKDKHEIFILLMAITPTGTQLSCEPHFAAIHLEYEAKGWKYT